MSLIPGSSTTDPRYANYNPGRPLTLQEMGLRQSLGAAPMSSSTNYNAANFHPAANFGSVLGAATSNLGGSGTGGSAAVTAPSNGGSNPGVGAADLALKAALANAQSYRDRGMQTFNDLIKSVNAFRDRAGNLRDTGAQAVTNTASEALGSNAKTAQQLAGTANAQGRNLGLSSKINLGQKILGNLEGTQGSTIATKGENLNNNQNLYQGRMDQANNQEAQANQYKQGVDAGVNQIQAGGLSDYTGALSNIVAQANALAGLTPLNAGGLSGYTPNFSGVTNTLNTILGSTGANSGTGGTTGADATNLAANPTLQDYLKRFLNPQSN